MMIHHPHALPEILSCKLDYRTGGSLLERRPGSVFKSAEANDDIEMEAMQFHFAQA
jgi:hypothetical protein